VILSDRSIREALSSGRVVIDPLDEARIQPSSVDLKLDRLFRVFRNHTAGLIDVKEGLEDLNHGARQIKRVVRNYLEFPLADLMLSGRLVPGTTVTVKHDQTRSFLNFEIMIPGLAGAELQDARACAAPA